MAGLRLSSVDVEFAVLGELRVLIGGLDTTPHAAKERALLALLAIDRGRVVSVDRLLEELWPDLPPERGRRVLQVRVAELRKRFGGAGAGGLLQSVTAGYRLQLGPDALDADRFEVAVEEARALAGEGDTLGAAVRLRDALGLWRGAAYADAQDCPSVETEAARLDELRLVAIEARIAAELADGCHQRLVPELDSLVAAHPLREGLWEQRVLALYRCGRQADALRAHREIRERLRDELGVEPGPGLRDLEAAVLEQRPSLDWASAGVASPTVEPPATNLPATEPLVGRELDVTRVVDLVKSHRLVTITGPGGVGKSRLALAVADRLAGEWEDGTWLVELAPLGDPSSVVGALAGVLPLPAMPTNAVELVDQIGSRQMLVVLDNCEHLIEDAAILASQLMTSCPGVRLLCTSQEALAVDRENVWPLQPLAVEPAVELFGERARAVRPDVVDDPEAVADIARRLDGLPLAIELAAARSSTLSPVEIAARLDDRFALLSGGVRGRHPRHQALSAMVDWGHEVLDPDERRLFRRLGIFSGSFTRDAVSRTTTIDADDPQALTDGLDHLVRRSLVVAEMGTRSTRYRLLDTLRHYALDRLTEAGETEIIGRRHAEYYAGLALNFAGVNSPDETMWLEQGVAEFDNLRAAVGFAVGHWDTDLAVRLVGRLWPLSVLWRAELLDWARHVLALPGAAHHPGIGYVEVVVGTLAWVTGEIDESLDVSGQALRRQLDEDAWIRASSARTSTLVYRGRFDEARATAAAARQRATSLANLTYLRASAISAEAYTGVPSPRDPEMVIADADATGIPFVRSLTRTMVALALVARHQPSAAIDLVHEALDIAQPGLNRRAVNIASEILALATGAATEAESADDLADRAGRALDLGREYPLGIGYAVIGLVVKAHRLGRHEDAALLTGYLTAHLEELGLPARSAEVMAGRPLDQFVTPDTEGQFLRGQGMTPAHLHAELERLAGHEPA